MFFNTFALAPQSTSRCHHWEQNVIVTQLPTKEHFFFLHVTVIGTLDQKIAIKHQTKEAFIKLG